ncbi:MAG TPA: hypothetical protein VNU71_03985 [Burkholderiaceae bacterium]|nr:hypothetical protein [Burkholderiaceae bacterium]
MLALLEQAAWMEHEAAIARFDEVMRLAGEFEFAGVGMKAGLLRAERLHRENRSDEAATALRDLLPRVERVPPADMYRAEAWWVAVRVFDACGANEDAMAALAQGSRWIRQVALPHVPDAFRESFLHRNPTHRALLAAARRLA